MSGGRPKDRRVRSAGSGQSRENGGDLSATPQSRQSNPRSSGKPMPGVTGAREDKSAVGHNDFDRIVVPEPYLNGRLLAFAVLQELDRSDRFVQDIFADFDHRHRLSSADRALAVDVAAGVVRRALTLDALLESRLTRPRHKVEPELWRVLRIGAFQLLFARTPDHAAVDSTVDLCRQLDRDRWTGFVNGILRSVGRLVSDAACHSPSSTTLPLNRGKWRELNEAVLPDPVMQKADYVSVAFSLPKFLASRWVSRMPDSELITACFQSIDPPVTSLRVNRLRSTVGEVLPALIVAGCQAGQGKEEYSLQLEHAPRLESLPGYAEGYWSVQDEAAMSASLLLAPRPDERILDLCAAPGGKTTHLAELSGDQATITACDVATARLQRVSENASRLRLTSIRTQLVRKDGSDFPEGPFDAVLVDVPCSNTGVLNRRPEARWRVDEISIRELVALQTRLLFQACERVRSGGRVVYSTCSLEPEENRGVIDAVLALDRNVRLDLEVHHLPGQPADGAYQALLVRI